jgi:hypothetical protein
MKINVKRNQVELCRVRSSKYRDQGLNFMNTTMNLWVLLACEEQDERIN